MPNEVIKFEQLDSFIENVTEEISDSNLFLFTKTTFEKNHFNFNNNLKIITSYLNFTNEYFFIFYKENKKSFIEFEYLNLLADNSLNKLIIYNGYFFLFQKKDFYYYQEIDEDFKDAEIKEFVEKRFNFKVDKMEFVTKKEVEKLKNKQKLLKSNLNYLKKSIPLSLFYALFLSSLLIPCIYGFYSNYEHNLDYDKRISSLQNKINKKAMIKKEIYTYEKLSQLFFNLKSKNIKALSFNYKNSKIDLLIQSKNKKSLYEFFKTCKKLFVNSMVYQKKEDVYESKISFIL